ncbi:MAG TPA: hypothetical protein VN890_03745 [Methylocella sp.]|nr:hypothetical protein [Methylocella sp.]
MTRYTTATEEDVFDDWFDAIETDLWTRMNGFTVTIIEAELATAIVMTRALRVAAWVYGRKMATPSIDTARTIQRCAASGVRAMKIRSRR